MLSRIWIAGLALSACSALHANSGCPELNEKDGQVPDDKRPYSVLAFVGGDKPATPDAASRRAEALRNLQRQGSNELHVYWQSMAKQIGLRAPNVELITCNVPIAPSGVVQAAAESMVSQKVIGVYWTAVDGGSSSVVHVSISQYKLSMEKGIGVLEVAWRQQDAGLAGVDGLSKELTRQSIGQQTFLALGIGLMSADTGQWLMARRSLCQVLANLKSLSAETVRPPWSELESAIRTIVKERLAFVDGKANAARVDVASNDQIRLACLAGGVQ